MRRLLVALAALSLGSAAAAQDAPKKGPPRPAPPEHVAAPQRVFTPPANVVAAASAAPAAPVAIADPENVLALDLSTGGRVLIQMRPDKAPNTVARVKTLSRQHFYDGLIFHRVIDGFMAQGGDPTGTGQGGSKLPNLKPEFNDLPHVRGATAMARADAEDSANSQFYIMFGPRLTLDGRYTVWGRVISGMQFVDALEKGEPPSNPSKIVQASVLADHVAPPPPGAAPPPAKPLIEAPEIPPPGAKTTTTIKTVTKTKPAPR